MFKIEYDLPYSATHEMGVLGGIITIGNNRNQNVQKLLVDLDILCFHDYCARQLFTLIQEFNLKGKDFDFVSINAHLHSNQKVQQYFHSCLETAYVTENSLLKGLQSLLDLRCIRERIKILTATIKESQDNTFTDTVIEKMDEQLQKLNTLSIRKKFAGRTYEQIAEDYLSESDEESSEIITAIPGLPPVPNRALITIAGRSGMGKSFFAMYLMDAIIDALPHKKCLYFNLEMHERIMLERHINLMGFKDETRKSTIRKGIHLVLNKNVNLYSIPLMTIEQIESESRLAALSHPISVIVVDYIGLIRSKSKSERKDLEQADIAKRLAALSIELDCIVIALVQANRDFKTRAVGARCPQPSDASESMGTVHSSTWWIGIDQPQNDDPQNPEFLHLFQLKNRKNRNGQLFELDFDFRKGMFSKREKRFSQNYVKKSNFSEID